MLALDYTVIPWAHGRKEIIEAIKNQLEKLDYTMPFQQGYGGSFELATMIAQKTPEDLNRIFIQFVDLLQSKLLSRYQWHILDQLVKQIDLNS